MITCVTYNGEQTSRFDREYYTQRHLPLVRRIWEPVGLEEIDAFFPASTGAGFVAMAICKFRDLAAYQAAMSQPGTAEIMADVQHFTEIKPVRYQLRDMNSSTDGQDA